MNQYQEKLVTPGKSGRVVDREIKFSADILPCYRRFWIHIWLNEKTNVSRIFAVCDGHGKSRGPAGAGIFVIIADRGIAGKCF